MPPPHKVDNPKSYVAAKTSPTIKLCVEKGKQQVSREQLNQPSALDEQEAHQSAENSSVSPSASSGRMGAAPPNPTDPRHLLQIQRTLGNQATVRYLQRLGKIQRQVGEDAASDDIEEIPQLDPEIEATLEGLFSADRQAAPTEVMASSTGAELSYTGIPATIGDMWQRQHLTIDDSFRQIAEGNTTEDTNSIATQSATLQDPQERPYSQRWGMVIANSDYPDDIGDLPSRHAALQAGSPFESALQGSFDQHRAFENATSTDVLSHIRFVINELMLQLQGDQVAELVIYLAGHGNNGTFTGVDGEDVEMQDLRDLGEMARQYNIHPVIILDMCTSGTAVQMIQERGVTYLRGRIDQLPPDQQSIARQQLDVIAEFAMTMDTISFGASDIANTLYFDPLSPDVDLLGSGSSFDALRADLNTIRGLLESGRMDVLAEPTLAQFRTHFDQAMTWINDVATALELPGRGSGFPLRPIARVLDDANTVMNNVLRRIDDQIHALP